MTPSKPARRHCTTAVLLTLAGLLVTGCGGALGVNSAPSPTEAGPDVAALIIMRAVAPKALKLDGGTPVGTDCWTPSEHLFTDPTVAPAGTWKVLCRVHYRLNGELRYQDATCIGNYHLTPMLDHCYVWKFHYGAPRFEDGNRLASPPPNPLP